jgi:hypothetical protein
MKWRPGIRTAVGTPVAAAWAVAWSFTSLSGFAIAVTTFSIGMGLGSLAGALRDIQASRRAKRAETWDDFVGASADAPAAVTASQGEEVTVRLGDESWYDGAGWYYFIDKPNGDGACGAFGSREMAIEHAIACGFTVRP